MKNNLYKAALLVALGLAISPAAKASNDLLVGFNDAAGNAGNDYVIDLGTYTDFTLTSTFNGSISSSVFNTAFGSDVNALNNVAVGAVAAGSYAGSSGLNGSTSGTYVFQTGSLLAATPPNAQFNAAKTAITGVTVSGANTEYAIGTPQATTGQWDYEVAQSPTSGDVSGTGVATTTGNPESLLVNGDATLTLYYSTTISGIGHNADAWAELGTLTIDANSGVDTISYAGVDSSVPEPTTYGIFAGAGLLLLALRRQFSAKIA